jgi:hypothetical protein
MHACRYCTSVRWFEQHPKLCYHEQGRGRHTIKETNGTDAVKGQHRVLGTIMSGSRPWVDDLKERKHVTVWEVTAENRGEPPQRIRRWLQR